MSVRPLLPGDVSACREIAWAALSDLDLRLGQQTPEQTPELVERGRARIAHLQRTDPESAWVAEVDGEPAGCGLALVRDGMWFLSLLMVRPEHQGKGLGRVLLDATLQTSTDRSWILATADPAALRRYQRAGFELHASYTAHGRVDRRLLPTDLGVVEGDYARDADLVDAISREVRGASLMTELPFFDALGWRLRVVPGKGFLIARNAAVTTLAARDDETASRLLWAALAEAESEVEVDWLVANQQWAINVCLDARLALKGGATVCLRGQPPMSPYLPGGAFG